MLDAQVQPRLQAALLAAAVVIPSHTAACEPTAEDSETVHSCSPNYIDENKLGRLSVQQRRAGSTVAWGVHPETPAERYVVSVYAGPRKVDGKNQDYPPHGSLPATKYKSGQIFKITGKAYDSKGNVVQSFFIKCRLA